MDAYLRHYVDAEIFSGVVRVTKGDRVVYENAFGLADRALGVRNTLQTKFQIASLSKPITATAILLLVQDGKIALDDKLAKFVPDFPNADKITIEELLTHYSGLGDAARSRITASGRGFHRQPLRWSNARKKFPDKMIRARPTSTATPTITSSHSLLRRFPVRATAIFSGNEFSSRRG
jgi:CubicO group peptidase (beta-lactamase class C family)